MAIISKPVDINKIWAASGDVLAPSDTKISQGWQTEIPPRQFFNYIDGKQDQAIAHINQYGLAVWDSLTEYQYAASGAKSLVMGSNGIIYRAKQTNVNQNPVLDTSNTYWELAFASLVDVYTKAQVDAKTTLATAAQAQALTNAVNLITPLTLAQAFQGTNQNLTASGYQKLPGGLIVQWGGIPSVPSGGSVTVNFPVVFPNACFRIVTTISANGALSATYGNGATGSTTQATVYSFASNGSVVSYNYFAIGY